MLRRSFSFACFALGLLACSSSGSQGSDAGGDGGGNTGDGTLEQLCVDTINGYRKTLNLPPYARWSEQEQCASRQAWSDAMSNEAHGAFGQCMESAQNECPAWPSGDPKKSLVDCLAMMWAEGPGTDFGAHGHYVNMSSTKYTKVACGFETTSAGKWWSVQDFK